MVTNKSWGKQKKRVRLTIKQSRLIAFLPQTKTQREAAILAGYKDCKYTKQLASQAIAQIRRKMPDLLEDMGVSPEAVIYRNLLPLMNATQIKFLKDDTEFVEIADNATQLKALDIYFRLMGAYAPKEQIKQEAATLRAIFVDGPRPPRIPESKDGDTK